MSSKYTVNVKIVKNEDKAHKDTLEYQATLFLKYILKEGQVTANKVLEEAGYLGFAERTVKRAKAQLGVESLKVGKSGSSVWYWRLNEQENDSKEAF